MFKRLLINDFKKNKLVTLATCIFMAVSAALIGLTVLLFGSLLNSIDNLMSTAKTPDFLQMHSGEINEEELKAFALSRDETDTMQIAKFLNIENSLISIGDRSLSDSTQDNGLCIQSEYFDYLVGMDNEIIEAKEGEVYVPVCYKSEYDVTIGQTMDIGGEKLKVAGFLRDSQMNSMMASSKRFLVSNVDYEKLKDIGSEEYLIEFLMKDGSNADAFSTAYVNAGLPSNGPTITGPLIKMMNALSDGMMIIVILLGSVIVLLIALTCIRYIVMTGMEKDRREVGMLKAIGVSKKDRIRLYLSKYIFLSATGAAVGFILSLIISRPLSKQMTELYGPGGNSVLMMIETILGIALTEAIILLSVRRILKKYEKISAVDALRGTTGEKKRKGGNYAVISIIVAWAIFIIIVPRNIANTISSEKFVTYMGVGNSQIRMDVRQTKDINAKTLELLNSVKEDSDVNEYALMQTKNLRAVLPDETRVNLLVEFGKQDVFPLTYIDGNEPLRNGEISLSKLNADELGIGIGDAITLDINGKDETYNVCGIYSDITNGGKTAKVYEDLQSNVTDDGEPVVWSVIYITLNDSSLIEPWISKYKETFQGEEGAVKIVDVKQYMDGTYGQTISRIKLASTVSLLAALLIIFIVVLLFIRLAIWQERNDNSLKKALGIKTFDIKTSYIKKAAIYVAIGIVAGIILGNILGQQIAGMMLGSLGASGFKFIVDPFTVYAVIPSLVLVTAMLAVLNSLREINSIKAYECCVGRE